MTMIDPLAMQLTQQLGPAGSSGLPFLGVGPQQGIPSSLRPIGGLASQVPLGAGQQAFQSVQPLFQPSSASRGSQLARQVGGGGFRAASQAGRASLPGMLAKGGLGGSLARGAPALGADLLAGQLFGQEDESFLGQAGRGFLRGAGWAPLAAPAVAGALGPAAPAGLALLGAAAGVTGVAGAALDLFDAGDWFGGGDKGPSPEERLQAGMAAAGLTPEQRQQILSAIDVHLAFDDSKDAKKALYDSAKQDVLALYQQNQAAAAQPPPMDAANMLAMQQLAAETFAPIVANTRSNAQAFGATINDLAQQLPAEFRPMVQTIAAQEVSAADRLADAYAAQAQLLPAAQALTRYQGDLDQLAQQQFSMAFGGGGTSGGGDLLAQLEAQGVQLP